VRSFPSSRWRARWFTALFVIMLIATIAFGGAAINANDPPAQDNSVGSLGAPPPTAPPTATSAPTATTAPTATDAATTAPTTASATPASSAAAPAAAPSGTPAAASPATTSGTPAASATSSDSVDYEEIPNGGGGKNVIKVQNKNDNRLRVKAKIQLNHIPGDTVEPVNYAQAYASCSECQTFAVALQIDLISRTASTIAPQNAAIALNVKCSHCTTYANAIQYVVQVDDPSQVPDNVRNLVNQMQTELNAAAHTNGETAASAQARIDAVIAQFNDLGQGLYRQHQEDTNDDTPGSTVPPDAIILTPTAALGTTPTTPTP
jgi:hypothetical protein